MSDPIPCPPSIPFLGTISSIDRELPLRGLILLAKQFGEIFQLRPLQKQVIFVNTVALATELSDETRFHKTVRGNLLEVRNGGRDGLFTAHHNEPSYPIAHRILMPAFGPAAIRDMFDDMVDVCNQMLLKWERFGPDHQIDPTDDYTRLTFDTIALCSMSYRFNSFYKEETQPFVVSMSRFLAESFNRANRPALIKGLYAKSAAQYEADIKAMNDVCDQIFAQRKAHPTEKKDLLNLMINGKDPQTGLGLSEDNIKAQLITFLVAGHETSSGLASFATYYLLKNPATYAKARAEVDAVLGSTPIRREHLSKLPYINAVLRETLRLSPSAPAFGVCSDTDQTLANGKYFIPADTQSVVFIYEVHRDPAVWGPDAEEFNPNRMLPEPFEMIPKNAWKPFGNGMRACIGRGFALQEIVIALACILQKFDLRMAEPSYSLELHQNITIKPKDFRILASPRVDRPTIPTSVSHEGPAQSAPRTATKPSNAGGKSLYALYGGNTGSCEGFAQKLAEIAGSQGFNAQLLPLDSLPNPLPKDGPLIIFTASFEGQPADNAVHFVQTLKDLEGDQVLTGVNFTVFGCGNKEWASTYQAIPRLIDDIMGKRGANRLLPRAEADAGGSSFFEIFDSWEETLWPALGEVYGVSPDQTAVPEDDFVVQVTDTVRAAKLRQPEARLGKVIENRVLTKPGVPVKRHLEFQLPEGTTYRAGDYLAILPNNPPESVKRCLHHFGLHAEQQIAIKSAGPTTLPIDAPISISELLSGYVELAQPVTRKIIHVLSESTSDEETRSLLELMATTGYQDIFDKRLSVLDVLEAHPKITLSFGSFIRMLPSMRARQYSISSSPLWNAERATLTISIVDAPALAGHGGKFLGVASNYLANLEPGDYVAMAVRPATANFRLPEPETPIVMFCAGAGLAPMRGFIQERAAQLASGRTVGKTLLFLGCRTPTDDYLYADSDLKEWVAAGAVEVRPAFSRKVEQSEGCKYVQDRVLHDKQELIDAFNADAKFYTCGSMELSNALKDVGVRIIQDYKGLDEQQSAELWTQTFKERYATDVFG